MLAVIDIGHTGTLEQKSEMPSRILGAETPVLSKKKLTHPAELLVTGAVAAGQRKAEVGLLIFLGERWKNQYHAKKHHEQM